jgi:hypothetical protein
MSFNNLSHAEISVLKGIIGGGGSTSECLLNGFVMGDLSMFSGSYARFVDAWQRLDNAQQIAVIDVFEACNMGNYGFDGRITPTLDNFVFEFVMRIKSRMIGKLENDWFNENQYPSDHKYYDRLPDSVTLEHQNSVADIMAKHL